MPSNSNPDQLDLGIPASQQLARPPRTVGAAERTGYHWGPGCALPSLGQHSVAKHDIYDKYVDRYVTTLTRNHRQTHFRLTIVDGFCGGGLYKLDGITVAGSPLRLIEAIEAARARLVLTRPEFVLDVDFVFIDENRHHVGFLEEQLRQRGYGDQIGKGIKLLTSTFEDAIPAVIDAVRKKGRAHRSLFFLDQYGWSDVRLATVRRIMGELSNPEVVLTFMVDSLINLLNEKTSPLRALAAIELKRPDVQELLRQKNEAGEAWKRVLQNTVYRHITDLTGAAFYTPFFVHPPESHRDYWLIHLSKHHEAREQMGNVFWEATNTMEHFGGAGLNALGFDPNIDVFQTAMDFTFDDDAEARSRSELLKQIPPLLHDSWKSDGVVTKRSLFASRANDTPVVGRIIDSQLSELRNAGEVIILGKKRGKDGGVRTAVRERADQFGWDDEIRLPRQPRLFSFLSHAA